MFFFCLGWCVCYFVGVRLSNNVLGGTSNIQSMYIHRRTRIEFHSYRMLFELAEGASETYSIDGHCCLRTSNAIWNKLLMRSSADVYAIGIVR